MNRFDDLVEHAPLACVLIDATGRIERANEAARRLLGVAGMDPARLEHHVVPEHAERLQTLLTDLFTHGVVDPCELHLRSSCGSALWGRLSCRLLPDQEPPRALVSLLDISADRRFLERSKANEARFRGVLDAIPDAVFVIEQGRLTLGNTAAAALLGQASTTSLQGASLRELLAITPTELEALLETEPIADIRPTPMELRVRRPDGRERFAETVWLPMLSHGQGAWLCVARDLTSQRELQAKLAHSERLASIGALASGVAHEINNPLQYIMMHVQQIAELLADAQGRDNGLFLTSSTAEEVGNMLAEVAEGTQRVARIVKDIKGQTREGDQPRAIDATEVVKRALELASPQLRYHIRLVRSLGAVPRVWADAGRMIQVVLNLLINAAQALRGRDGACIEITTAHVGDEVCIGVKDNGPGIPAGVRSHIFEAFFTTKSDGEGSGLGLFLCRQYVVEYGGEIDLSTVEGEGACFTVRLPVFSGAGSGPHPAAASVPVRTTKRQATVLVVDDEPSVRHALRAALRRHATVVEASSAAEAVERIRQRTGPLDAILCDLQMPEGSGADLYEWIDGHRPELLVNLGFMTGGAFTPETREFLEKYDPPWLEKPFSRTTLGTFIDELIGGRPRRS